MSRDEATARERKFVGMWSRTGSSVAIEADDLRERYYWTTNIFEIDATQGHGALCVYEVSVRFNHLVQTARAAISLIECDSCRILEDLMKLRKDAARARLVKAFGVGQ